VNRSIRRLILLCVAASCPGGAGAAEGRGTIASRLVGHWSLMSVEVVTGEETEYPLGRDVSGVITYDATRHMAVQIMQANRPLFASGDQAAGTPAELSAAVKGYVAYFGTYSVDEDARVVTHQLTGSLFPNWVGTSQRRSVMLEGDKLTLSSQPIVFAGKQRVFRIVWKR
jgi:Lipocalin-like domain